MIITLLTVLFAIPPSFASDGGDATDATAAVDSAAHAEYIRLSQELEKLATRNAWPGVERTYLALIATGVPPKFEDHLIGAHSAKATGDMTSARARLLLAKEFREEKEVLDWLWEIDSNYGKVFLACDPGNLTLRAEMMPFEPDQAHAVEFAMTLIAETGMFEGYLPQGKYFFGDFEVKVQPYIQATKIDMRTDDGAKGGKKPKKKKTK